MRKMLVAAIAAMLTIAFVADAFAQTRTSTCTTNRVGNTIHTHCRTIVHTTATPATAPTAAPVARSAPSKIGANNCNSMQARCAIEAGGYCNPATGGWKYACSAGNCSMRYNDCISRHLAGKPI